jgi:hypothetical protein
MGKRTFWLNTRGDPLLTINLKPSSSPYMSLLTKSTSNINLSVVMSAYMLDKVSDSMGSCSASASSPTALLPTTLRASASE